MAIKKEKFVEFTSNGEPIFINTDMIQCVKPVSANLCQITVGNSVIRVDKTYDDVKNIIIGNKTLTE